MDGKDIDGIVVTSVLNGSHRLEGGAVISSETRKRYGVDFTSIMLGVDEDRYVEIGVNTADLVEALIAGGITADDLRLYADIVDVM